MLKHISFREDMSEEFFYCGGVLLVNSALPASRKMEIIEEYLQLES